MNTWTSSEWFQVTSAQTNNPTWTSILGEWNEQGQTGTGTILRFASANTLYGGALAGFVAYLGDGAGHWVSPSAYGQSGLFVPYNVSPGAWYNVTETVGNGAMNVYVNGSLAGSSTLSGTPILVASPTADLTIGYDDWNSWQGNGLSVDDFQLYNTALSAAQAQAIYFGQAPAVSGGLPINTPVVLAAGATWDLNGLAQTVVSLSGSSGAGGTVTNGSATPATLVVAPAGGSATFSGTIQDGNSPTSLILSGPGTQVLTGSNTYSGATTIGAGTLQVGNGGPTGSINGTSAVLDNGLLVFDVAGPAALAAPVSGSGSLMQMGPGVLTLTGSSTYSGPTTISGGTLQLGNNGTSGSIDGTSGVADSGTLAFHRTDPVAFQVNISGPGGVQQMGPGVLTLTGSNTYTGPTIISGGTLQDTFENLMPLIHYTLNGSAGTIASGQAIPDVGGNGQTMYSAWGNPSLSTYVTGGVFGANAVSMNGNFFYTGGYSPNNTPAKSLPALNTWTASEWFQLSPAITGNPVWATLLGTWNNSNTGLRVLYSGPDAYQSGFTGFYFAVGNAVGSSNDWAVNGFTVPYTASPNTWCNLTETVGNGVMNVYVNGALEGSTPVTGTPLFMQPQADLTIGYDSWGDWTPAGLSVGNLQIYNTVLSPAQVALLVSHSQGNLPTTPVEIGAGVLDLAGYNQTVASLGDYNGGGGRVTNTSSTSVTLTLAPAAGTNRFSGTIENGAGGGQTSLVINGAGIEQFDGVNTFTGPTTVAVGTLSGTGTLSGPVTVGAWRTSPPAITPPPPISAASAP